MHLLNMITHRQYFVSKTKQCLNPFITIGKILTMLSNGKLLELLKIGESIQRVESNKDGDLYIEFKNNIITAVNGSNVLINKEEFIVSYRHGAFSPNFKVEELVNIRELDKSIIKIVRKRKEVEQLEMEQYLEKMKQQEVLNNTCGCEGEIK